MNASFEETEEPMQKSTLSDGEIRGPTRCQDGVGRFGVEGGAAAEFFGGAAALSRRRRRRRRGPAPPGRGRAPRRRRRRRRWRRRRRRRRWRRRRRLDVDGHRRRDRRRRIVGAVALEPALRLQSQSQVLALLKKKKRRKKTVFLGQFSVPFYGIVAQLIDWPVLISTIPRWFNNELTAETLKKAQPTSTSGSEKEIIKRRRWARGGGGEKKPPTIKKGKPRLQQMGSHSEKRERERERERDSWVDWKYLVFRGGRGGDGNAGGWEDKEVCEQV